MKQLTLSSRALAFLGLAITISLLSAPGCDKGEPATELLQDRPEFSSTTEGPVLLRYKFEPGELTVMTLTANMEMDAAVMGQELSMNMVMEMEANYLIESVNAEGNAIAVMTITELKMDMEMPGMPGMSDLNFDSSNPSTGSSEFQPLNAMLNVPIRLETSARGALISGDLDTLVAGLERAGLPDASSMDQFTDQLLNNSFVQLPEDPVSPGDVYDGGEFTMAGAGGAGDMTVSTQYEVLEISGDGTQVLLRPIVDMGSAMAMIPGASVEMESTDGWLLFDLEAGNIVASDMAVVIEMSMMGDGEMNMTMTAQFNATETDTDLAPVGPADQGTVIPDEPVTNDPVVIEQVIDEPVAPTDPSPLNTDSQPTAPAEIANEGTGETVQPAPGDGSGTPSNGN